MGPSIASALYVVWCDNGHQPGFHTVCGLPRSVSSALLLAYQPGYPVFRPEMLTVLTDRCMSFELVAGLSRRHCHESAGQITDQITRWINSRLRWPPQREEHWYCGQIGLMVSESLNPQCSSRCVTRKAWLSTEYELPSAEAFLRPSFFAFLTCGHNLMPYPLALVVRNRRLWIKIQLLSHRKN